MKYNITLNVETDKPTSNGTIYTKEAFEKAINDFNERMVSKDKGFVYLSPDSKEISPPIDKICGKIKSMKMEGNNVNAVMEIMNTPTGKLFDELKDKSEYTPMGVGSLTDKLEICDDYKLIGISMISKENYRE